MKIIEYGYIIFILFRLRTNHYLALNQVPTNAKCQTVKLQWMFIQQSGIPLTIVNLMKAPPGTVLFEKMEKEGWISKPFAFLEGDTNIVPAMGEKILYDGFLEVITSVYNPEKSFQRIVHFLNTYRFPKTTVKVPAKYSIKDLIHVSRVLYLTGIKDQPRIFHWKLLLWSIKNSRKKFSMALFYGVMICQIHQTLLQLKNPVKTSRQTVNSRVRGS